MDQQFKNHSEQLWKDPKGADERFFGFNVKSKLVQEKFFQSPFIHKVHDLYEKGSQKSMFTMAGRIRFKDENLGSGQGWHRDRVDFKQSKSIIYLTDTDGQNGPSQYIEKSHKPLAMFKDYLRYGISLKDSRITDAQAQQIIASESHRLKTFHAPAGTLLFVDTRGIHRGHPLIGGERYALTNYIWYNMSTQ